MTCKICKNTLTGRSNKLFCSIKCKNHYHTNLRRVTRDTAYDIDIMLHRNRSILLELMGKHKAQKKVNRRLLEKKKFNFKYMTHLHVNSNSKTYHYLYDFAWMEFSDDEILLVHRRNPT